jgi:uncharacterized protein YutE (UPF0331/DUF86 family)
MYYVNYEQIQQRLDFIPLVIQGCERLNLEGNAAQLDATHIDGSHIDGSHIDGSHIEFTPPDIIHLFAQERILHLAIETVTDLGSLLIDAFVLRDASSYEDIIEILRLEQMCDQPTADSLHALVKLRKLLTQDYMNWDRTQFHPAMRELPRLLLHFQEDVLRFMKEEVDRFSNPLT